MTNQKVSASNPKLNGRAPHLLIDESAVADVVLLPGDPARVLMFKDLLEDFNIVSSNREFVIGKGKYQGKDITICSTGIGGPSTEIAVIELIELGAKALIRIGGTGSLKQGISCGDMIINTGAMRKGGASNFYAPPEYPAVASYEVLDTLANACKKMNTKYWMGISASVGSFFAGQGRLANGKKFHNDNLLKDYENLNIINMEMEAETILTLGSLYGVYTGSICAVHADRVNDIWLEDFAEAQLKMCTIALEASVELMNKYL
ncbi:MAG: nucleoside phosphorylase [Bacilli bacterium]